ncbi:MBL fold metallo-hydrolase [Natrinema gelatinilyticum]|uniref:MBL fold metallo-hydrolase n=1 Tax=Natrinema gelatinilyticum TaxID=2961571 RepID=UPI0020C52838|nr:rhodanese-like domain-containing protein [Natrinema gelatinilyticum]
MQSGHVMGQITPQGLMGRIDYKTPIADVRSHDSYEQWHIPGAIHLPYDAEADEFEVDPHELFDEGERIVVVCAHGNTSRRAASALSRRGFDAATLEDGMLGWSQVFDVVDIDLGSDIVFKQAKRVANGCLSYVVGADGEAMIVDPVQYTDVFERNLKSDERFQDENGEVDVKYVALTHIHADHISSGCELAEKHDADLIVGAPVSDRTEQPGGCSEFRAVADGKTLDLGGHEIKVLHTPGHTMESTSYLVDDAAMLTGDTQFVDSVGRPDLEHGDEGAEEHAEVLYESIFGKILTHDDDVSVFPAHYSGGEVDAGTPITATIGEIKATNEAVQKDSKEEFVDYIVEQLGSKPANHEEIIAINEGKNEVEDPEIELGPNKCAVE